MPQQVGESNTLTMRNPKEPKRFVVWHVLATMRVYCAHNLLVFPPHFYQAAIYPHPQFDLFPKKLTFDDAVAKVLALVDEDVDKDEQ